MPKQRIITGLGLGLLLLLAVFVFPTWLFSILVAAFIAVGAWEWTQFIGLKDTYAKAGYVGLIIVCLWGSLYIQLFLMYLAAIWWVVALVQMAKYPKSIELLEKPVARGMIGLLVLVPVWSAATILHHHDPSLLFLVIFVIALSDTAAYFVGSQYGKNKMAPKLSPKKSYEGLAAALVVGALGGLIWSVFIPDLSKLNILILLFMMVLIILVAVFGDLFESMYKRQCDIKDSGNILPGHGGILDRIDALLPALPIAALGFEIFRLIKI